VRPDLVAEVKFAERTNDGRLRAPVFLRLREDKTDERCPIQTKSSNPHKKPGEKEHHEKTQKNRQILLAQLDNKETALVLDIEGQKVPVSHLEKELWPESQGFKAVTKRELMKYLVQISPYVLPAPCRRPLSLSRYPNGHSRGSIFSEAITSRYRNLLRQCPCHHMKQRSRNTAVQTIRLPVMAGTNRGHPSSTRGFPGKRRGRF